MESAAEDFSGLKVSQLKERLATLGLKVSGKKADLVDRLQQQQQVKGWANRWFSFVFPCADQEPRRWNGTRGGGRTRRQ